MYKIAKFAAAAVMVVAVAASSAIGVFAETFSDMPNDWRTTALEHAVSNGLISGMGDGTIAPDANITRAQMAAIIVRALGATRTADLSEFTDVSTDAWYYGELSKAVYMQAFSGDEQKKMNPENNITFQECFTVISNVFGLYRNISAEEAREVVAAYSDGSEIAEWALRYYGSLVKEGYWTGGEKGLLTPTAYITRGEFAVVMDNLVQTYITEPGVVEEIPEGNIVVRCSDVVFDGKTINGDLIVGDGVEANRIGLDNIDVKGRLVIRGCATPGEVEYIGEDGKTYTTIKYTDVGCAPSGIAYKILILGPYVNVDLTNIEFSETYIAKLCKGFVPPQTIVDE